MKQYMERDGASAPSLSVVFILSFIPSSSGNIVVWKEGLPTRKFAQTCSMELTQ
ncbi:hypothetical protein J7E52_06775 [Bacillus sp. ISL-34]|uniref:hypothetical protein n=1 Tax=Bacillus sp. ISL-34 TaxID=2819121 RepID=UPI001BEBE171|nr:hypothetical protein [Bacillus sp. ISL-34]MBT2646438.1 hypothetical protein [Bacillus sp. ISL-34]